MSNDFTSRRRQSECQRRGRGQSDGSGPCSRIVWSEDRTRVAGLDVSIAMGIDASAKALKVHLPSSRVILLGILPRGDLNDDVRRRIMKINRLLIQADAQSEYAFCDIGKVLLTEDGDLYWDSYMQDKLHLISGGYSRIAEPITKLLAEDSVKCD